MVAIFLQTTFWIFIFYIDKLDVVSLVSIDGADLETKMVQFKLLLDKSFRAN